MNDTDELQKFVDQAVDEESVETAELLDAVDGGRGGARDVALSYLGLGEIEKAQKWATAAAPDYLRYARFVAEGRLDASDPPDTLGAKPWIDALTAMQLATFAGDEQTLDATAAELSEWASLPFLDDCPGRENTLLVDVTAALASIVRGESPSQHFESLRDYFAAMESPTLWAKRDRQLGAAVKGIDADDVQQVETACNHLDEYHEALDTYESKPMEIVNIHGCFCVAFARQQGLDVRYTSTHVPESVVTHF